MLRPLLHPSGHIQMTLFVALFVLNEKRAAKNYRDCCCCPPCAKAAPTKDIDVAAHHQPTIITTAPVTMMAMKQATLDQPLHSDTSSSSHIAAINNSKPVPYRSNTVYTDLSQDNHPDENVVKKFFRTIYAPLLAKWWFKAFVLAVFVAYAVISWVGIYRMKFGQPLSDLAPDGSYLQDYDAVQRVSN